MPYFDDIELGDEIGPVETVATDEGVASFCEIWNAPQPNRFTDLQAATDSGMPGLIVPGIMAMAMMGQLLTDWAGPNAIPGLGRGVPATGTPQLAPDLDRHRDRPAPGQR